jgi:hypothetical protein
MGFLQSGGVAGAHRRPRIFCKAEGGCRSPQIRQTGAFFNPFEEKKKKKLAIFLNFGIVRSQSETDMSSTFAWCIVKGSAETIVSTLPR